MEEIDLEAFPPVAPAAAGGGGPAPAPASADIIPTPLRSLVEAAGPALVVVAAAGAPPLLVAGAGAPGVAVELAGDQPWPLGSIAGHPDLFALLNTAHAAHPIKVTVSRSAPPDTTVVVVNWMDSEGAASFPRLLVEADPGSEAAVVEINASADVGALVVPVTELGVGAGARLRYTNVQVLGPRVRQVGLQASHVASDATLTSASVALGGDYARVRTDSALVGRGASGRLLAVWLASGHQMPDLRTVQDHRAPHTTSELIFKGAVANHAHSVYTGVIRVEKGAGGTNAMQTNRNLVLDEGAHADSVPNLEIEDNDVRCSHASAVGPIDEDQRFYLESRGVPTGIADRLITLGFLDEVLAQVPAPGLVGWLRLEMARRVEEAESPAAVGVGA